MNEETGTPEATAPEATPETTPVETPQSFIDGTGNFQEGWQAAYLTEDQRANARVTGGRVTSVQNLLDTVINSDKMISGDKILKPSDSFGDEDWDNFHKAGGWTGETISMAAPEGLPDGIWSEERATAFSEVFNKLRLSPAQQAGITEAYNADLLQQITDMGNNNETSAAELKANLLSEWGNAYTQKEHLANFTVEKGTAGDAEFKERLLQKFGNDPDFIKYSANLGSGFSESGSIPHITTAPTPVDIQQQLDEIRNSDAFMKPMHPGHKEAMANIRRLHIEKASIKQPA
jgi:hypothetical protein